MKATYFPTEYGDRLLEETVSAKNLKLNNDVAIYSYEIKENYIESDEVLDGLTNIFRKVEKSWFAPEKDPVSINQRLDG